MWISYTKKGKQIKSDYWDWCLMNVIIENYIDEGYTFDDAYKKFWMDVRESDPEDYDLTLEAHGGFNVALGDGYLDEIRNDYLEWLDMEAEEIEED
jgi:hypothetical protein